MQKTPVSTAAPASPEKCLWIDSEKVIDDRGYVVLRRVLDSQTVQGARLAMNQLVDEAAKKLMALGKINDALESEPFESRLYRLFRDNLDLAPKSYRHELHLAGLYPVFFNPGVLDMAELILGPEIRLYPNYTARPKLPDWEGTLVLWHQDGGYTESPGVKAGGLSMVNVWSPLVPATRENGCMQFIPGSHKLGVVPHVMKTHYLEIPDEVLEPLLGQAVDIVLDPGDVVLFHNLLFHHGLPNRSSEIRWSLDWRYQDATQETLRPEHGHLARSRQNPDGIVRDARNWESLSFC